MITYKTQSGSVYDVEGKMVRRRVRSKVSVAERVSSAWREAESIEYKGLGQPMLIVWGMGQDEHSENAMKIGEGENVMRTTLTTPIVEVFENLDDRN